MRNRKTGSSSNRNRRRMGVKEQGNANMRRFKELFVII
jgi:hypothetical protein